MDRVHSLSPATRWGMIAAGLLQGLLCYILVEVITAHALPAINDYMLYGVMSSVAISMTLLFAIERFRQPALWVGLALVLIVVCAMGWWVSWNFRGIDSWRLQGALIVYALLLLVMVMLMLPWLQARLQTGHFRAGYAFFYQSLWLNGLSLLLIFLTLSLVWTVLCLWAELFELLNIGFFSWLFLETKWFFYLSTGLICALVLILARSESRLIQAVQSLLAQIARGLLLLVALIVLLFMVTLPFVGLETISTRISAAGLLNCLIWMLLVLVAVVWAPEKRELPYPQGLRYLVRVALILSPLLALLAGWAMWVRIAQYGWTPERVYGALITVISLVWACGYAFNLIRRWQNPLPAQGRFNQCVALFMLAILILIHSPVLDRYRISVNSQMARYHSGQTTTQDLSLSMLDEAGRRGHAALRALQQDANFTSDSGRVRTLNTLLGKEQPSSDEVIDRAFLQRNIQLASTDIKPDNALWEQILIRHEEASACLSAQKNCWLLAQDLNQDGNAEWIYFNLDEKRIIVFTRRENKWSSNASVWNFPPSIDKTTLLTALEQGQVKMVPKVWQDLSVNGKRIKIDYYSDE